MVYDTKNRLLIKGNHHKVKLTKLEHKLLIALSSEKMTLYDEISEYMYGCKFNFVQNTLPVIKSNLCKKANIKIKAMSSRGYILKTDIVYK